jgi:nucleoside-diphosphate-sugar epimerase
MPEAQAGQDKTPAPVLVTGANGYIASWLVKRLLDSGTAVHAAVRDPDDAARTGHLHRLAEQAQGSLTLFQADLLRDGAYDAAMHGCATVYHTASPFMIDQTGDPDARFIAPALQGTRNVLNSVDRTATVRRVVLTSSVAAIYGDAADCIAAGGTLTETHWNTSSSPAHNPYAYAKTVAERAAWDRADAQQQENPRWRLVVVNPGLVLGPSLSGATQSGTFSLMRRYTDFSLLLGVPDLWLGCVDVRDVAEAHWRAGTLPGASGRHILVAETDTMLGIGRRLRRLFGPFHPYPRTTIPKPVLRLLAPMLGIDRAFVDANVGIPLRFDATRAATDLGLGFRPLDQTLYDHFHQAFSSGAPLKKCPGA